MTIDLATSPLINTVVTLLCEIGCALAVYNNEFILGSACVGTKNYWDHKIIENLLLYFHFNIRGQIEVTHQQRVGRSESWIVCVQFLLDVACQKLSKSANVSWSYSKNKSGTFFI